MIDKSDVEEALATAERLLAQESGFAWIKKSSLLERAYFAGLFGGLRGIASEDDIGHILIRAMRNTMFPRSADDSFQSTGTGVLFDSLKGELMSEHLDDATLVVAAQRFVEHVEELERELSSRLRRTKDLLDAVQLLSQTSERDEHAEGVVKQRDRLRLELQRQVEELEQHARHFALVETDHRTWKRLQD